MRRSEVIEWLRANGGQKGQVKVEYEDIPNPKYHADYDSRLKIPVKKVTWTAANGQTLSVLDQGKMTTVDTGGPQGPDPGMPGGLNVTPQPEPDYDVVGGGPQEDKEVARTPEKARTDQQELAEREANLRDPNSLTFETNAERKKREEDEFERKQRTSTASQQAATAAGHLTVSQAAEARQQAGQAHAQTISQGQLDISRRQADLAEAKANQPQVLGTPTDSNRQIGMFDPTTGTVKAVDNPLYDEAKVAAKQMQEDLALAIQMNKLTADQAAAQYTQWFKANVEVPFMQASEARAQAAEKRAALEAVERKRQFAATNQIQRAQLGQSAASTAINAEIGMLPHTVGPAFGEQMSSAITSLAQGGKMDGPAASAGVNFTKDAFEYDAPDIKKIAKEATKAALKGVTPYDPGDEEIPTADYTGISMPTGGVMGGAPAAPSYIDTNAMYQNWINSRYAGPTP